MNFRSLVIFLCILFIFLIVVDEGLTYYTVQYKGDYTETNEFVISSWNTYGYTHGLVYRVMLLLIIPFVCLAMALYTSQEKNVLLISFSLVSIFCLRWLIAVGMNTYYLFAK
jgi:hypothetical protein